MHPNPKTVLKRLNRLTSAWQQIQPDKAFGGLTLAQFREATQPALVTRARLIELENELSAMLSRRTEADLTAMETIKRVVAGVKADPAEGENGQLYENMGYVRTSARKTGLKRPRKAAPAAALAQAAK